ncbi:TlpA disulfide reductase family protein [Salinicoccus sp. RF5]|uniref:TlpA family protein disulfide reductase n=1 Tax=Salinicoccus sp. RF5 TaxID=2748874 RepID=UPI001E39B1D5|nr:TlpA disulfide reductase family protein [Salinicoccus sp. RF5]MCC4723563.1 TlpA family protein disulfide reductase [Salinicoccus sp. RF5]
MKKIILIILVVGMVGWAVYEYIGGASEETEISEQNESEDVGLEEGQTAPDFLLTTLEGEEARLSEFRGQPVIINFWATWCPPCRAEMPDFQKLYEAEDVEILAVNLTESEQSEEGVQDFIDELGLTFPVPMDQNSIVSEMYEVQAYPTSYIVDSDGKIQFTARGAINYDIMQRELSNIN